MLYTLHPHVLARQKNVWRTCIIVPWECSEHPRTWALASCTIHPLPDFVCRMERYVKVLIKVFLVMKSLSLYPEDWESFQAICIRNAANFSAAFHRSAYDRPTRGCPLRTCSRASTLILASIVVLECVSRFQRSSKSMKIMPKAFLSYHLTIQGPCQ